MKSIPLPVLRVTADGAQHAHHWAQCGTKSGSTSGARWAWKLSAPSQTCPNPHRGIKIYPYLMKSLSIDGPNQAWCVDITYIRLDGGFVYLVAIMDWCSRKILVRLCCGKKN